MRQLLFCCALIALVSQAISTPAATTRVVKVSDKDTKAALKVGDMLSVRLVSNPSTGYGWQVTSYDKKLLRPVGVPEMEESEKKLPGAPGRQVFKFRALAPGTTTLEMHYIRPWEKNKPAAQVYKISIVIAKSITINHR